MPWLPTPWLPWASTCGAGHWRRKSHNFVGSPHFKFLITSFKWALNTAWLAYCNPPIFSMHSLLSKYSAPSLLSSKISYSQNFTGKIEAGQRPPQVPPLHLLICSGTSVPYLLRPFSSLLTVSSSSPLHMNTAPSILFCLNSLLDAIHKWRL